MKNYHHHLIISLLVLLNGSGLLFGQFNISNYSNLNYVNTINITHDTIWIGTNGGLVVRDIKGNFIKSYTVDNKLSSNNITAISVDSVGNKWLGTIDNGLMRFNGDSIKYYSLSTGNLPPQKINCLEVDESGNLWIGLNNGVAKYDGTQFQYFSATSSIFGIVKSICVDGKIVWFGTEANGIFMYNGSNWSNITSVNGLTTDKINDIAANADTLFIATDKGIDFYLKSLSTPTFGNPIVLPNCLCIEKSPKGVTWVGTNNYMVYFSFSSFFGYTGFGMKNNKVIKFAPDGTLWAGFGAEGGGAKSYDGVTEPYSFEITGNYPSTNNISDIDVNNNLVYFGTVGKGIIMFDGANWSDFYANEPIINAIKVRKDTIYAGTPNGYTTIVKGIPYPVSSSPVHAIAIEKSGIVWMGTESGIKYIKNNVETSIPAANLLNPVTIAIAIDSLNVKWFLHSNGLTRYDGSTYIQIPVGTMSASGAELFDIAVDTLNGIWIASSQGVINYNGTNYIQYSATAGGLSENRVLSVFIGRGNIKYFGTASNGISMYNGTLWKNLTRNNHSIATNKVTSIKSQPLNQKIWIAGDYGGISSIQIEPLTANIYSSPGNTICPGVPVTLNASVYGGQTSTNRTFSWTSSNGSLNANAPSVDIKPTITTTYYLQVSDGFNIFKDQVTITVVTPTPSAVKGNTNICSNQLYVDYSYASDPYRNYTWEILGGTIISDQGISGIQVLWDASASNWQLILDEFDYNTSCSIKQQIPIILEKINEPNLRLKGRNLIICVDSGMARYDWYLDDVLLTAPNRQFYYLDRTRSDIYGNYTVSVQSFFGCKAISKGLLINVIPLKAYPNPVRLIVNIEFYKEKTESATIEIFDLNGTIKETILEDGEPGYKKIEIGTGKYKPGIYSYRIKDGPDIVLSGSFIKE